MTDTSHPFDFSRLSVAERILLAQRLWDSIDENADTVPTTEAQMAEINRRLDAHGRGELPAASPWEDVDAWLATL